MHYPMVTRCSCARGQERVQRDGPLKYHSAIRRRVGNVKGGAADGGEEIVAQGDVHSDKESFDRGISRWKSTAEIAEEC